jgi:ribosomal protein S27E
MKDRHLEDKPGCSVKSSPVPSEVTCHGCGTELEIWSDETDIACKSCGCMIQNTEVHK